MRSGRRLGVWDQAGGVWRDLVQCEGVWGGVIGVGKELLGSAGGVWKGLEDSRPQHTPPRGASGGVGSRQSIRKMVARDALT